MFDWFGVQAAPITFGAGLGGTGLGPGFAGDLGGTFAGALGGAGAADAQDETASKSAQVWSFILESDPNPSAVAKFLLTVA
jgi:hypothetical protein